MFVGFAQSIQTQLISVFFATFEVHRVTDVGETGIGMHAFDAPAHTQQQRRDQRHQPEGMIKHHQAPHTRVAKQPLGAAEQAPLQAAVGHRRTIDFLRRGFHLSGPIAMFDELTHLTHNFRDHLHSAAGIVADVLINRRLPRDGLQVAVNVGG